MNDAAAAASAPVGHHRPSVVGVVWAALLCLAGCGLVVAVGLGVRSGAPEAPAAAASASPSRTGAATVGGPPASVPPAAVPAAAVVPTVPVTEAEGGLGDTMAASEVSVLIPPPSEWPSPESDGGDVVLVGDSLAQEIAPVLAYLLSGRPVIPKFWGGTAPCDWLGVDLEADRSSVVVISFTGNSLTPCMDDGRGGHLHGSDLVDRYRADIEELVARAGQTGAQVVLVGQPYRAPSFGADIEVDGINDAYRTLATKPHVSFVDAGATVETPDGRYTDRLPCAEFDVGCAPDGTVVVRGDGVHFCPIVGENPCPVWSGGAVRFAMSIASAIVTGERYEAWRGVTIAG